MISQPQSNLIDLDLVDEVVRRIPAWTWSAVRDMLVTNMVDAMPASVLESLTNDPVGFDRAEEILHDYYCIEERNKDLIADAFQILGDENTLYMLDGLQLDKIAEPTDNAPCSINPV
jgi:hypothetical protein